MSLVNRKRLTNRDLLYVSNSIPSKIGNDSPEFDKLVSLGILHDTTPLHVLLTAYNSVVKRNKETLAMFSASQMEDANRVFTLVINIAKGDDLLRKQLINAYNKFKKYLGQYKFIVCVYDELIRTMEFRSCNLIDSRIMGAKMLLEETFKIIKFSTRTQKVIKPALSAMKKTLVLLDYRDLYSAVRFTCLERDVREFELNPKKYVGEWK